MKEFIKKFLPLLIFIFAVVIAAWYCFQIRPGIILAYQGKPTGFLDFIIQNFYPRFSAEKERLELTFFLQKADQVIFRIGLVSVLISLFIYLFNHVRSVKNKIQAFSFVETTRQNVLFIRVFYYLFLVLIIRELYIHLTELYPAKEFYKPILLLKIFHLSFPHQSVLLIICVLAVLFSFFIVAGIRPVLFSLLNMILIILLQGWYSSFEKTDHGFVTFNYGLMILPFLFLEVRNSEAIFKSWSLRLIQVIIVCVYFISGIEKITISGFSWLQPETLRAYIYLHQMPLGILLSKSTFLCIVFSVFTLTLQLLFHMVLFTQKHKWIILSAGILFHMGTLYILGIGHFFNPWIFTYIFFIDWTREGLLIEAYLPKINFLSK